MPEQLRLMCVLAHPDDEALGIGGTLAKYAAEGIETYLVTATRGERGWQGAEHDNPGLAALGAIMAVRSVSPQVQTRVDQEFVASAPRPVAVPRAQREGHGHHGGERAQGRDGGHRRRAYAH